jgi:hypothetical protein
MCWSVQVSLAAAVYGYAVSAYLYRRKYSARDPWYAAFLATFTTTQLCDALLWTQQVGAHQLNGPITCNPMNRFVSRWVIPPVVFFQPFVLSFYPSQAGHGCVRNLYRLLSVIGSLVLTFVYGCTTLYHGDPATDHDKLPTLLWGGVDLPLWTIYAGIALWSIGAVGFVRPVRYGLQILLVGGCVLMLLRHFDGTIVLLSKMCTYCLLLSIVWTLEPCWDPHVSKWYPDEVADEAAAKMAGKRETQNKRETELGEGLLLGRSDIEHKESRAKVVAHHHQHPHRIPLNVSATVVKVAAM